MKSADLVRWAGTRHTRDWGVAPGNPSCCGRAKSAGLRQHLSQLLLPLLPQLLCLPLLPGLRL